MPERRSPARGATGRLAAWLIRALGATWRVRSEGTNPILESHAAQLGAMWHRDVLIATWWFRDLGIATPVSRSADGELITPFVVSLGYREPPRGSRATFRLDRPTAG